MEKVWESSQSLAYILGLSSHKTILVRNAQNNERYIQYENIILVHSMLGKVNFHPGHFNKYLFGIIISAAKEVISRHWPFPDSLTIEE